MAGLVEQLGDGVGIPESNQAAISTSIDILDEHGNNIGYLTSLNRRDSRPVDSVRHLNAADAGRKLEGAPHVEEVTVDVTGFALYPKDKTSRNSLLNRLPQAVDGASAFKSLNSQKIPFILMEKTIHPANPNKVQVTTYVGCWLTAYSKPTNIGTATIAETASIWVQAIEED
jgi:hypothetical protein